MARNLYLAVINGNTPIRVLDEGSCLVVSDREGGSFRGIDGTAIYKIVTDSEESAISAFNRHLDPKYFEGASMYRAEEPLENINKLISRSEEGVVERVPSKEVSRYLSLETVSLETD